MRTSYKEALELIHKETLTYTVDYKEDFDSLIELLEVLREENNFNPKDVIKFIKNLQKIQKKLLPLERISLKFGREYSEVLYITVDVYPENQEKILKEIKRAGYNLKCDEYSEKEKFYNKLIVRMWWD